MNENTNSCIQKYDICVISNGAIYSGNTVESIHLTTRTITFGINQKLATKNHKYCAWGGLSLGVGDTTPSWFYRTYTLRGGWSGEELYDVPMEPLSLTEFMKYTKADFNLFLVNVKSALKSEPFKYEYYGYRKGEEP